MLDAYDVYFIVASISVCVTCCVMRSCINYCVEKRCLEEELNERARVQENPNIFSDVPSECSQDSVCNENDAHIEVTNDKEAHSITRTVQEINRRFSNLFITHSINIRNLHNITQATSTINNLPYPNVGTSYQAPSFNPIQV